MTASRGNESLGACVIRARAAARTVLSDPTLFSVLVDTDPAGEHCGFQQQRRRCPNITPAGIALVVAGGVTLHRGTFNVPVNLAVVPSRSGIRVSLLAGFRKNGP